LSSTEKLGRDSLAAGGSSLAGGLDPQLRGWDIFSSLYISILFFHTMQHQQILFVYVFCFDFSDLTENLLSTDFSHLF
jgi:hypothetical protein